MWFQRKCILSLAVSFQSVVVANAGLVTGLQQEQLLEITLPYGGVDGIVMLPGKSYCFIIFKDILSASKAYAAIHGKIKITPDASGPLYLAYTEKGMAFIFKIYIIQEYASDCHSVMCLLVLFYCPRFWI
jgi:hypothetical protein